MTQEESYGQVSSVDRSFDFADRNSSGGPARVAAHSSEHLAFIMGGHLRKHGAQGIRRPASTPRSESHRPHRGKSDGWHETLQGRLRWLPWHPNTAAENETNVTLYPNAPQFALHPPSKPDYQLFWIVKGGIRYTGMFAWGGQFAPDASGKDVSDEKIWTAVTFLTHLHSLPPAVDAEWRKKPSN
jgi:hypothetical protein